MWMTEWLNSMFVVMVCTVGCVAAQEVTKPVTNPEYLGSEASKIFHFPWLITIHREDRNGAHELVGSGSILTNRFSLASMDSFVRYSQYGYYRPFFTEIKWLVAYSGGIWGAVYLAQYDKRPYWLEKKEVTDIIMWSALTASEVESPKLREYFSYDAKTLYTAIPEKLGKFKTSPFGLSNSVALIKTQSIIKEEDPSWSWRSNTLPLPLFSQDPSEIKKKLSTIINLLENAGEDLDAMQNLQCFVGGWRIGDWRLVGHKVVYVPLKQCQDVYCRFDSRACGATPYDKFPKWPIKNVHGCFQSLSFTGLCWTDQGSALYCRQVDNSAIAILTTAPTCGLYGLPGVFTWIHHGMSLLKGLGDYEGNPDEVSRYTPPPKDRWIPAYR